MTSANLMLTMPLVLALSAITPANPLHATTAPPNGPSAATVVPWSAAGDADPTFTPDRHTVVFAHGNGSTRRLYVAHWRDGAWSAAERAPFSGAWMDFEPTMAPDGSYLIFISNRPTTHGGKPLDGYWGGKSRPGRGGNLWRVDFKDGTWSAPVRLPDLVNVSTATYSPAVAADGSVYFTHPDPQTRHTRLYVSRCTDGRFQPPRPLSFSDGVTADYDPAVAPDQSFIVFSSERAPTPAGGSGLFVAFATAGGWGTPVSLATAGIEARLDPDLHTLRFSGPDHRIHSLSLVPRLAHHAAATP